MAWTALGTSLVFGALAMAVANRARLGDGRLWVAFAVGGALFFAAQFVSRPVVALGAALAGPMPEDAPGWPLVAVLVLLAELFKLTTALLLHQAYGMEAGEARAVGAAVGAGFGVWSEAVILHSVFQVARLGLPGGSSLGAAVAGSLARVLASTASTGLGTHLCASGRLVTGLVVAGGVQLVLDPGLRLLAARPGWMTALTLAVGGGAFAALSACGAGRSRCR